MKSLASADRKGRAGPPTHKNAADLRASDVFSPPNGGVMPSPPNALNGTLRTDVIVVVCHGAATSMRPPQARDRCRPDSGRRGADTRRGLIVFPPCQIDVGEFRDGVGTDRDG